MITIRLKLRFKVIYIISLLLIFGFALGAIQVDVVKPKQKQITIYYKANGKTKAKTSVDLKPEVSGYVEKIYVQEGQRVKKGQLLAKIEDTKYKKDLQAQQHLVERAKGNYEYNKTVFLRKKYLYEKNLISENEFLTAKRNYFTSKNELEAEKKKLEKLQIQLEKTKVKSPFDGLLDKKYINTGDYVNQNQKMFYIFQPDSIVVEFFLPQRFFFKVKKGQKIKFSINKKDYTGTVIYKSHSLNDASLFKVQLKPVKPIVAENFFAKIYIPEKRFTGFEIPERAIHLEKDKVFVFTVVNKKVRKKFINIVSQQYGKILTDTPFKPDEFIILDAPPELKEGTEVEIHQLNF